MQPSVDRVTETEHTKHMSENVIQDVPSNLTTESKPAFSQEIRDQARKFVRTAQTFAPGLVDAKFAVQRRGRRLLRRPSEVDYRALALVAGTLRGAWVDVGANRGQTIDAMRLFSRQAPIIAFEPNVRLADRLTQHYRADPLVTIHAVGLGDEAGALTLYIPAYRGFMFDGLASLIREEASTWLEDRVFRYDPSLLTVDEIQVEVVRLDDFALSPTFMKLDVQGYELAALRGASGTIGAHRPVIMVEAAPKEGAISEYLVDYGYEIFAYRPEVNAFIPGEGGLNSFFLAGSHRSALPILRTCE
jgi:FkbM family methyltransferase